MHWPIGKFKDLPNEMKPAFEKLEGSLPSVKYLNGTFYRILWVSTNPLHWPEELRFPLNHNDSLVLTKDYGVKAVTLGGLHPWLT